MSSESPGSDPEAAEKEENEEDTNLSPQQGETSENERPSRSEATEERQFADISQFNEIMNNESSFDAEGNEQAVTELSGLLESFAIEDASIEGLIRSFEAFGLSRIVRSEELGAVTANQSNEIDSNEDTSKQKKESVSTSTASSGRGDASSDKELLDNGPANESNAKPDHKRPQSGKGDSKDSTRKDAKESKSKADSRVPRKMKCGACGSDKRVLKNGQLVPHLCPVLEKRANEWVRRYGNRITEERLRALAQEALRRVPAGNVPSFGAANTIPPHDESASEPRTPDVQNQSESTTFSPEEPDSGATRSPRTQLKSTSYSRRRKELKRTGCKKGYRCGKCGHPYKALHVCPYAAGIPLSTGDPGSTANSTQEGEVDDRKPAARPRQDTAKKAKAKTIDQPAMKPRQETEEEDRKPAAQPSQPSGEQEDQTMVAQPEQVSTDEDESRKPVARPRQDNDEDMPSKRHKKNGTLPDDRITIQGSAEEAVLPDSTEGSADVLQEETAMEETSNEVAEPGSSMGGTNETAAPMQVDTEDPIQSDSPPAPHSGTPKGDETDDDFEAV